jgi:hypothetical protein
MAVAVRQEPLGQRIDGARGHSSRQEGELGKLWITGAFKELTASCFQEEFFVVTGILVRVFRSRSSWFWESSPAPFLWTINEMWLWLSLPNTLNTVFSSDNTHQLAGRDRPKPVYKFFDSGPTAMGRS